MNKSIKLIKTNSYFNLFPVLCDCLNGSTSDIGEEYNYIFCEDKISLFVERSIMSKFNGSFNTQVFSFGSFLKGKKSFENALSKEGSAMVIRKLLLSLPLKCFSGNKNLLASSIYDLIILLKSAKVTLADLKNALDNTAGILKNKLSDVYLIYSAYEEYLKENNLEDQSSILSYLPNIISQDENIKNANVYLVGFSAFTSQTKEIMKTIFHSAKSVTAILTAGDNPFLFVNETARLFESLVKQEKFDLEKIETISEYGKENQIIIDNLFGAVYGKERRKTAKIHISVASNQHEEIEKVAVKIRELVNKGARYKDFTVSVPSTEQYKNVIHKVFLELGIPYFLDEKKNALSHPLVKLVVSYIDALRFNKERSRLLDFVSNPLICEDKVFLDEFANYLYKYNVNYGRINVPFEKDGEKFEPFRKKVCALLENFNVFKLLEDLRVEEKIEEFSVWLNSLDMVESAINAQCYGYISNILKEINTLLSGVNLSLIDYKNVFLSGVSALELSIIPQYNDAVFIGEYRECALAKSINLFMVGLNGSVPECKNDVSLLTDSDINKLQEIKVLVEPKIQIVNARSREQFGMSLVAFSDKLYLSYVDGDKNSGKSIAISNVEELFITTPIFTEEEFFTVRQGAKNFAKLAREYSLGKNIDMQKASAFYYLNKDISAKILESVNKELKVSLDLDGGIKLPTVMSPTTLESFFACPFKAFCSKILRLLEREEGKTTVTNVGNFVHAVLDAFVNRVYIEKTDSVKSFAECDLVSESCAVDVLNLEQFAYLKQGAENKSNYNDLLREVKKHCRTIYERTSKSSFKPFKTEAKIGDKGDFPPISLLNGKIKVVGTIDRVDVYKDYFRIIDYKTGSISSDIKELYSGNKLQLYLYALAIKDKTLAGAHYMKLSDEYLALGSESKDMHGNILNKEDLEGAFLLADGDKILTKEEMDAYLKYAVIMGEQAGTKMSEGVIVASPVKGACTYCAYKSICGGVSPERKIDSIRTSKPIIDAVNGLEDSQGD